MTQAKDDETFVGYCRVWRHYLQGWLSWNDASFERFVAEQGTSPSGVLFHEEPWYWVFPYLIDTDGHELPCDDNLSPDLLWQKFYWQELHRAIYRDVAFHDWTANDDEWAEAKSRAEELLSRFGFRLAIVGTHHA